MSLAFELESWLGFFRSRAGRTLDAHHPREREIGPDECRLIGASIATFQLGESSDGAHLLSAARAFATQRGVPALDELTALFIREEQFHAGLLAGFMTGHDIPFKKAEWSDRVFRALRRLAGFELAVHVLIVAELIALTYYRALAGATRSATLRSLCATIVADERAHLAYESTLLLRLREARAPALRWLVGAAHRGLYAGAALVVFAGHRAVLEAGGYAWPRYWRACRASYEEFLGAFSRAQPAPRAVPRVARP